ncbi:MAG TPA: DNA mismatch repair endonuclease MutL [Planctomycetes bacterium]|nr:DNA mismatch repair endonuclease MutL [Planctomycetota bacterium]
MPKIVVLDDNMVNMIAAGEVIERPASVVKELVENSIDAGAGRVAVNIEDGGRKLISVVDDGMGMDAEDLARAFEPHATSKIATSADLLGISTMGFRGEALASIAAVGTVDVVTRAADSIEASCLSIDCGKAEPVSPCSGDYGTTIEVRDLFYKVPARRKFLRTANTEMTHIIERFTRIALAHCDLDMKLTHNGRQLYHLVRGGAIRDRIAQLTGPAIADDLIELETEEKSIKIAALLGRPTQTRANNKLQYVFLNGRFIRDKFISHALREAYRGLIEPNKFPIVFLFLEMPPDRFDVNVHPTKIEVRFDNANLVHSAVLAALREKLLSINFEVSARMPIATVSLHGEQQTGKEGQARRQRIAEAMADFFKHHKPAAGPQQHLGFSSPTALKSAQKTAPSKTQQAITQQQDFVTKPKKLLQIHNSYIVTEADEGFVIIDQHALHERIIYEDLCRKLAEGNLQSQQLLMPETFDVTGAQAEAINSNARLFEKIGVRLEPFGPGTMAIQAFPSMLAKVNRLEFIRDLLDVLTDTGAGLDAERVLHEALDMAACKAAIKAGQALTPEEMAQLIADKDTIERAGRCPHGRPTTIKFTLDELQKQFKRT